MISSAYSSRQEYHAIKDKRDTWVPLLSFYFSISILFVHYIDKRVPYKLLFYESKADELRQ